MQSFEIRSDKRFDGLDDKLDLIRRYYDDSLMHASVRALAEEYSKDAWSPSLQNLFVNLKSRFHYIPDPVGVELIKSPWAMAGEIAERGWFGGDCDDAATLSYAMLHSLGVPAKLAVAWKDQAYPTHILVIVPMKEPPYGLPFDLTARALGQTHPDISRFELHD